MLKCLTFTLIPAQIGYFFFFYSQENSIPKEKYLLIGDSYLAWFLGICLGCLILNKLKRITDFSLIIFGILISLMSVIFFWSNGFKNILDSNGLIFDLFMYGLAGFGSGIFLPCFYSIISQGHSNHVQGVLTGYIDSLRVIGDMITNISLIGILFLPKYVPILISAVAFAFAGIIGILLKKNSHYKKLF